MIERDEADWLAAQYTLGVLAPGDRKLVKSRLQRDPALAGLVQEWETRLAPLSLLEPGLAPPPRLLEGVLATVAQESVSQPSVIRQPVSPQSYHATTRAPRRAPKWSLTRPALTATLAAIAIALSAVFVGMHWYPLDSMTATLVPEASNAAADEPRTTPQVTFAVSYDRQATALTVRQTTGEPPRADRVHVLWLQPESGADAILIGHLNIEPMITSLRGISHRDMARGRLLITLETPGTGVRPRGPVLASGRLHRSR